MLHESYKVNSTTFDIEIAPAPATGKKYPIVILIHGNFGLLDPFGDELRSFTSEIAALGYLGALPSYYPRGHSNKFDTDIDSHVPALSKALAHVSSRSDADQTRIGFVGFSLGGGIAASYINTSAAGNVKVFADFYGLVGPLLSLGVSKYPPTIIFNNRNDPFVPVAENSKPLADSLSAAHIDHEPVAPYSWYDDNWEEGGFHAFKPGGPADIESRKRTKDWLKKYMPPDGVP